MRTVEELLSEIAEAKSEVERRLDGYETTIHGLGTAEEKFLNARWCILSTVEDYLTGKSDTLKLGVWINDSGVAQ